MNPKKNTIKNISVTSMLFLMCLLNSIVVKCQQVTIESEEVLLTDVPLKADFHYLSDDSIYVSPRHARKKGEVNLDKYLNAGLIELPTQKRKADAEKVIRDRYHIYLSDNNNIVITDLLTKSIQNVNIVKNDSEEIDIWDVNFEANSLVISRNDQSQIKDLYSYNLKNNHSTFIGSGAGAKWNSKGNMLVYRNFSEENIHPGIRYRRGDIDLQEYNRMIKEGVPNPYWEIVSQNFEKKLILNEFPSANRISWSPDGDYLIISDLKKGEYILKIKEENGQPIIATTTKIMERGEEVNNPVWSPDSKYVAYCFYELDQRGHTYINTEIILYNILGERVKILEREDVIIGDLNWRYPDTIIATKQHKLSESKDIVKFKLK